MELEQINAFKSNPQVRERIREFGIVKHFSAGETILKEDAYISSIPLVMEGSIRVMRHDAEGREILLYYINAGESCIMSFLGGMHRDTSKVTAIAEEDTELLLIPIEKVGALIEEFPEWRDFVFRLYHKRFEELLEVVNNVAFKKMDERLEDFLRKKVAQSNSSVIHLTHEQIANELGTVRVVVSRLLKSLETEGVVKLGRNKIELL